MIEAGTVISRAVLTTWSIAAAIDKPSISAA
jgi:hypothetical protein